ncbi:MAG TPA: phosphoribosylformylglycinamidine synthase subunit PurS [Bryobacteraceae bacterium]|nr:phosphoribosylformylglycinamidine synthase subunit PurS [Bryobacteraceae bacterium]
MKARVFVSLKPTVLDPQGQAIRAALNTHGHGSVSEVRQGKYFDILLKGTDHAALQTEVESIARDVLANPVIEDYRIDIVE